MASEFQQRKIAGVFDAMDADDNGFLEEADFELLTQRWVSIRGWEPGSVDYERVRAIMMGWWGALRSMADANRDDKVSFEELMLVVDVLPSMEAEVLATADAMFDAIDENGNDEISVEEHKHVVRAWKGHRRRRRGGLPAPGPQRRRPPLARGVPRAVVGLLARRRRVGAGAVGLRAVLITVR